LGIRLGHLFGAVRLAEVLLNRLWCHAEAEIGKNHSVEKSELEIFASDVLAGRTLPALDTNPLQHPADHVKVDAANHVTTQVLGLHLAARLHQAFDVRQARSDANRTYALTW
jgi:hypothetical protein